MNGQGPRREYPGGGLLRFSQALRETKVSRQKFSFDPFLFQKERMNTLKFLYARVNTPLSSRKEAA